MRIEIDIERIAREKIIAEVMLAHDAETVDSHNFRRWAYNIAYEVANAIAAHEREECARVCDAIADDDEYGHLFATGAGECSQAIRSRGTKGQ